MVLRLVIGRYWVGTSICTRGSDRGSTRGCTRGVTRGGTRDCTLVDSRGDTRVVLYMGLY